MIDVVSGDEPGRIVWDHVMLFTVQGLVQNMNLKNRFPKGRLTVAIKHYLSKLID